MGCTVALSLMTSLKAPKAHGEGGRVCGESGIRRQKPYYLCRVGRCECAKVLLLTQQALD